MLPTELSIRGWVRLYLRGGYVAKHYLVDRMDRTIIAIFSLSIKYLKALWYIGFIIFIAAIIYYTAQSYAIIQYYEVF